MKRCNIILVILFVICVYIPLNAQTYNRADKKDVNPFVNNSPEKSNDQDANIIQNEKIMQYMKEIRKRYEEAEERIKQVKERAKQVESRRIVAEQLKKELEQAKQKKEGKTNYSRRKRRGKLSSSGSIRLN